jgi:hypothetical protein
MHRQVHRYSTCSTPVQYTAGAIKRGKYKAEKLILTLDDVKNHVVHRYFTQYSVVLLYNTFTFCPLSPSASLELYCRLGLVVTKIHRYFYTMY